MTSKLILAFILLMLQFFFSNSSSSSKTQVPVTTQVPKDNIKVDLQKYAQLIKKYDPAANQNKPLLRLLAIGVYMMFKTKPSETGNGYPFEGTDADKCYKVLNWFIDAKLISKEVKNEAPCSYLSDDQYADFSKNGQFAFLFTADRLSNAHNFRKGIKAIDSSNSMTFEERTKQRHLLYESLQYSVLPIWKEIYDQWDKHQRIISDEFSQFCADLKNTMNRDDVLNFIKLLADSLDMNSQATTQFKELRSLMESTDCPLPDDLDDLEVNEELEDHLLISIDRKQMIKHEAVTKMILGNRSSTYEDLIDVLQEHRTDKTWFSEYLVGWFGVKNPELEKYYRKVVFVVAVIPKFKEKFGKPSTTDGDLVTTESTTPTSLLLENSSKSNAGITESSVSLKCKIFSIAAVIGSSLMIYWKRSAIADIINRTRTFVNLNSTVGEITVAYKESNFSTLIIILVVVSILLVAAIVVFFWWRKCRSGKAAERRKKECHTSGSGLKLSSKATSSSIRPTSTKGSSPSSPLGAPKRSKAQPTSVSTPKSSKVVKVSGVPKVPSIGALKESKAALASNPKGFKAAKDAPSSTTGALKKTSMDTKSTK